MSELLFVYGTLRTGSALGGLLGDLPRRGGRVHGRLWRMPRGYPALVPDPRAPAVQGEIIRLDDPGLLHIVDVVEGVPEGLYARERIDAWSDDGPDPEKAWAYVMTESGARRAGARPTSATDWIHGRQT